MNNFGFNGLNNNNPLAELFKQYSQPQNQQTYDQSQTVTASQQNNYTGIKVYEITKKEDLTYIKPDSTGQKQIIFCEPEKEMYIARYNYATEKPDYEKYISEGTIELFKKNDNSAEMSQIAEALIAVASKLETMNNEIQEIKNKEPVIIETKKEESNRKPNGQFKKKGEK